MARINLRPWREELRAELQRQFLVTIVGFIVLAVLYVFLADRVVSGTISTQNERNQYLQEEIAELDKKISEIALLEERRTQLIDRMTVIQELQGNRPVIVHIFDEMVRKLPDGVYFSSLSRVGEELSLKGLAESNNRISSLMRSLDSSAWFDNANLSSVRERQEENGLKVNEFDMKVRRSPEAGKQGGEG